MRIVIVLRVPLLAVEACSDAPPPSTVHCMEYTGPFAPGGIVLPLTTQVCTSKCRYPGPLALMTHCPPLEGGGITGFAAKPSAPLSDTLLAEVPPHISPGEPAQGAVQALAVPYVPAVLPQKQNASDCVPANTKFWLAQVDRHASLVIRGDHVT